MSNERPTSARQVAGISWGTAIAHSLQVPLVNSSLESTTNGLLLDDVFDAAVQTLINDRCHLAYVHDMRGGLQALYSAFEVLARSAKQGAAYAALTENASTIARRAMANHERAVLEIFNQVAAPVDAPAAVNVTDLVGDARRFLRNDASVKDIRMEVLASDDIWVSLPPNRFRTLLLGLLTLGIDALPAGGALLIEVSRVGDQACLELRSDASVGEVRGAQSVLRESVRPIQPHELVLGCAQRWFEKEGGRLEVHSGSGPCGTVRIYCPLREV